MYDLQGKFQYLAPGGAVAQEGPCRLQFDQQTLTLTPGTGAALAFDLGDLDAVIAADWELRLPLYTGRTLVLRQFGKAYDNFVNDLGDAYRNRAVQCMLLEDMGEVARFTGNFDLSGSRAASGTAEIRLYKSNLAVLPAATRSFQWRLADIDQVQFDSSAYEVSLQSGGDRLKFTRLAKRTEELATKLRESMNALATQTTQTLHAILPFLDPDELQLCAGLLREGRSASMVKLAAIHKQIPAALAGNAIDKDLKPYHDKLAALSAPSAIYAGFKLIRPEADDNALVTPDEAGTQDDDSVNAPDADLAAPETLYWFFFPLVRSGTSALSNVVAWEASSRSGRATYFFRLVDPSQAAQLADVGRAVSVLDAAIRRLNSVLAMLNFRRLPIYLSDDELAMDPRFHRYAIAARRLPEVREARASFLGRALHSSLEAWQSQADSIIANAAE
ncbi:MAG TPA: hypothetical protein VMG31_13385 [Verrucomicrobiae bacterium]|nr:hypothetical protein [Verrucomicrobiae bacterium]